MPDGGLDQVWPCLNAWGESSENGAVESSLRINHLVEKIDHRGVEPGLDSSHREAVLKREHWVVNDISN